MTITANTETLLYQAPTTAETYLMAAIRIIDEQFDEKGYAKKHPELVGAFLQTCAIDFGTAVITRAMEEQLSLRTDHPLMGETLDGITSALDDIATALGDIARKMNSGE